MREILSVLPRRPRSYIISYAITAGLVGICFGILIGLQGEGGALGFYVLFPAIFLAALLFAYGAGTFATVLSTALLYWRLRPDQGWLLPHDAFLPLAIFALIGLSLAVITQELRTAWDEAAEAERGKTLLFEELSHRTKNNLSMVVSVLSLEAVASKHPETRAALEKAAGRIHAIANAQESLRPSEHSGHVDLREYLDRICEYLDATLKGARPIRIIHAADEVHLKTGHAVALGLIVNELVTNALKHAFPDGRSGTVAVTLSRHSAVTLTVEDDGIGYPLEPESGLGSRLLRLLSRQLGATVTREDRQPGCRVRVVLPDHGHSNQMMPRADAQ